MTKQEEPNTEQRDTRVMWIATAVIVVVLVGGMGVNMLTHRDTIANSSESGQTRPAPQN